MEKQEVKITFTGPQGSGKTTFLRIAAKAIKEAGHEVTLMREASHSMRMVLSKDALRDGKEGDPQMIDWYQIESAPKDGEIFLAWYDGKFGSTYGTMCWQPEKGGRFHSMTLGTQTKDATHWARPEPPNDYERASARLGAY